MLALLEAGLTEEGYEVSRAADGLAGLTAAESGTYDLLLVDLMLPRLDGVKLARRIRESSRVPILFLTARDSDADIVRALDSGGDDYLTKPFSFEVLLARMRALYRRVNPTPTEELREGDLILNVQSRRVWRAGKLIDLTPREFALLELLLRNSGRVLTRQTILESIWGHDAEVTGNTLEVFVRLLRQKIDTQSPVKLLHTIRGVGYSLRKPVSS